ncbi:MAG: InlB B-repeat-containing protein, partial [Candidatus Riflebacteria bacterium]|nr:InlB B-repeat-containing protein [Candidatus Riflebacteria bacterium]
GEKLDGIKTDNLKARIVYRSDSLTPEQLKANGSIVKQTDSDDKAVSGTYEHSFEISNIKIESQMSGEAVVSFVLNLDGVSLQAFPTTFLVEFYSDGKAENTLPFTYIQAFSFETKEQQNEPLVTYSITYDLDGGEPTSDNPTSYTIESEITLSNPTKDGYTFLGWTGSNGNTPEETVTIAKGSTGDKSYKANWQQNAPNEYTLTLVAGTGIATVDENKAYKANESITLNCTVKDGYEFDKWSDSEGNAVTSPFTMPAKDMTLTANAKPITYTITLDPNGGTVEYTTKEYNVETADFTLPKVTKDYYTFDGWVLNDGEPVETVTITKGTHENRTYKAKFTPTTYKITLDPNGGTVEYTTKEYNIETADFTLPTPSKEDFEFIGWTWDGQTTPQISVTIKKGSAFNRTYTANWEADAIASLKSDATDFLINGKIEVQFDKDIAWQDSFKDNITITHTTTTTPITINTYSYSNKVLTLTPASNLKYNTEYQIAIAGMEKVSDKNLAFTTLALEVTPLISSQTSDITQVNGVDRLVLQPTFTIDFGKKVLDTTAAKSSIELNDTALPDSCSLVFDESGKIATLTFTADLSVFTDYTLSIKGFSDSDNASIKAESLSFKTIPPENITGEGTQSSPYLIYTQSHLDKLRENQYIGTSGKKYFKQMDDIILTSNWNPIIADDGFNGFTGYYDGNNKKIASLTIANVTIFQDVGLFAYIYDSRIENL